MVEIVSEGRTVEENGSWPDKTNQAVLSGEDRSPILIFAPTPAQRMAEHRMLIEAITRGRTHPQVPQSEPITDASVYEIRPPYKLQF